MVVRKFIEIDEDKCTGCGECIVACEEGALEIIDGVAKVVKEQFCDGLGACIGHCPEDALHIIEKDVEEFDEEAVEEHLKAIGRKPLKEPEKKPAAACGCPGMAMKDFREDKEGSANSANADVPSQLRQWPIQLHLVNPAAPYFEGANLVIAASCAAFSMGNFHNEFIKGNAIAIGCPKLDRTEGYIQKIADIISQGKVKSVTVARMEVPCCGGLTHLVEEAIKKSGRKVPFLEQFISIQGELVDR